MKKPSYNQVSAFRKSQLGIKLIPLGSALGLPLPYLSAKRVYIFIPFLEKFTQSKSDQSKRLPMNRPSGEIRIDALSGKLARFELYKSGNQLTLIPNNKPFYWFPTDTVLHEKWSREKYKKNSKELYLQIDNMLEKGFNDSNQTNFGNIFFQMVPKPLIEYYLSRVPNDWLLKSIPTVQKKNTGPMTPFDL